MLKKNYKSQGEMMKKIYILTLAFTSLISAGSFSNLQLLYGNFNGDSAVYDVEEGKGKTTLTYEYIAFSNIGDIFSFVDYNVADGRLFVPGEAEGAKTSFYSEIHPRLSLSYLSGKTLSVGPIKDFFIATELNIGSDADYRAGLIGLGVNIDIPYFDYASANVYYKYEKFDPYIPFTRDTAQLSFAYGVHFGDTNFSINGWFDWTKYSFQSQDQLLYKLADIGKGKKVEIGVEYLYYQENKDVVNAYTKPKTSVLQAMIKYSW
ncbi:MAG: hypothetical protein DSZ09_00910 [Sulfurovum sp.]|nr:MAG: hypothetical protein DSZ08_00470 [Sulfurovum sp.]RUM72824.1 MAG: hypothetical protein DSZ09_00910 [Sulfurovum sp.]